MAAAADAVVGPAVGGVAAGALADGAEPRPRVVPSVAQLFATFFTIGLTSFGMAILQNIRSVPVRRGWIGREEIDEGLGLVQHARGTVPALLALAGFAVAGTRAAPRERSPRGSARPCSVAR